MGITFIRREQLSVSQKKKYASCEGEAPQAGTSRRGLLHDHYFDTRTATMLLHLLYGQIMLLLHRKAPSTLCSSLEHKVAGNQGLLIAERLVELGSPNANVDRGAFWHYAAPLIILAYQLISDRHLYLVSRFSKNRASLRAYPPSLRWMVVLAWIP